MSVRRPAGAPATPGDSRDAAAGLERSLADAQHSEASLRSELEQRDSDLARQYQAVERREQALAAMRARLTELEQQLHAAQLSNRRVEESVTWQAFQQLRGRVYGAIGERSMLATALHAGLRLSGRLWTGRGRGTPAAAVPQPSAAAEALDMHSADHPEVSLIIPLYARADLTTACLNAIRDHTTHGRYEVILIDDAADRDTKALLERVRGATVLRNETNIGYLRGVNRAAAVRAGIGLCCSTTTPRSHAAGSARCSTVHDRRRTSASSHRSTSIPTEASMRRAGSSGATVPESTTGAAIRRPCTATSTGARSTTDPRLRSWSRPSCGGPSAASMRSSCRCTTRMSTCAFKHASTATGC